MKREFGIEPMASRDGLKALHAAVAARASHVLVLHGPDAPHALDAAAPATLNDAKEIRVEAGQAIIGSPETCARFINNLIDAGVDEVLLFMQGATTPHDKILASIRLFAEEVRPRLKRP